MAEEVRARREALRAVVEAVRGVANNRYEVRRGPVDVTAFDYGQKKYLASITTGSFGVTRRGDNFQRTMSVEIELSTEVHDTPPTAEKQGYDDDRVDELVGHAEDIVASIMAASLPPDGSDPTVFRVGEATAEEFATLDWTVQGIVVSFDVDF